MLIPNRALREEALVPGPAGLLETLLEVPEDADPSRFAVVCHPHPLHGGTMHTTVVHRMAKGLRAAGIPTLRFQFRGVGRSEGKHDNGRGELDDVRAMLDHAARLAPGAQLIVAGFSFGARVGLDVGARDARVSTLVGVGLPLDLMAFDFLSRSDKPKLLIQGACDEFGDGTAFLEFVERTRAPKTCHLVSDATHLFPYRADEVERLLMHHFRREAVTL